MVQDKLQTEEHIKFTEKDLISSYDRMERISTERIHNRNY